MPVITRMRNDPKVSAPKYHVALNSSVRFRALIENRSGRRSAAQTTPGAGCYRRCRCGRWSAICGSREPGRRGDRWCSPWLDPHQLLDGDGAGTVYQQVAIVVQPHAQPGERPWRWACDLHPVLVELAAVARASDDAEVRLICSQAAQVSADCREREESLRRAHDVDRRLRIERDRVWSIVVGFSSIDNR